MTVGTVVWRNSSSCGRTQTDSRTWENTQSHCGHMSVSKGTTRGTRIVVPLPYLSKPPKVLLYKDQHHKRRQHQATPRDHGAHFPRHLALTGPRIDKTHDSNGVEGREEVEYLEEEIPAVYLLEQIGVSGEEHEGVEHLRDEGYAC